MHIIDTIIITKVRRTKIIGKYLNYNRSILYLDRSTSINAGTTRTDTKELYVK